MSKIIPNTFQTPNVYVDELLELLTDSELKCLLFAVRHIYGWQDRPNSRPRAISLSMFQKGFATKTGKQFKGTGLSRAAIIKAVADLDKYRVLVKERKAGEVVASNAGQRYTIGADPDIAGLETRFESRFQGSKARTEKARSAKADKQVVSGTNQSVALTTAVSGTNQSGKSDLLNQSHSLKPLVENQIPPNGDVPAEKTKPRNPTFDTIQSVLFHIPISTTLDKRSGARVGMIAAWVKDNEPDFSEEALRRFMKWCQSPPNNFSPPRTAKFGERWLEWRAATKPKPVKEPPPAEPEFDTPQRSPEELQALLIQVRADRAQMMLEGVV